jgi:hypothetical protein
MCSEKLSRITPSTVRVTHPTGFKTVLGDTPMLPGQNYFFQIRIEKGGFAKIGVSTRDTPLDIAFCDTEFGWALYNGELRHASNS